MDAAQTIIADQTEFRLLPDQWDLFRERIDAPPQTIPALQQLFSESEPYDPQS